MQGLSERAKVLEDLLKRNRVLLLERSLQARETARGPGWKEGRGLGTARRIPKRTRDAVAECGSAGHQLRA